MTKSPSPSVDEVADPGRDLADKLLATRADLAAGWEITSLPKLGRHVCWVTDPEELLPTLQSICDQGMQIVSVVSVAALRRASLVSPPKAGAGEPRAYLIERLTEDGAPHTSSLRFNSEPETPQVKVTALYHEARGDGVRVTDEMVERAARAMATAIGVRHGHNPDPEENGWLNSERREEARAALEAALPPLGDGRAEIVEAQAFPKTLGLIHQAIDGYVNALVAREHGYVAESRAFVAICEALGRSPTQEMDARRRSLSNPGGGL